MDEGSESTNPNPSKGPESFPSGIQPRRAPPPPPSIPSAPKLSPYETLTPSRAPPPPGGVTSTTEQMGQLNLNNPANNQLRASFGRSSNLSRNYRDEDPLLDIDNSPFQPSSSSTAAALGHLDDDNVAVNMTVSADQEDDDIFGLKALEKERSRISSTEEQKLHFSASVLHGSGSKQQEASHLSELATTETQRKLMRSRELVSTTSHDRGNTFQVDASCEPPLAIDVRFPPLNPKISAQLRVLAAGNGSLFAASSAKGGVLQWGRAQTLLGVPIGAETNNSAKRLDRQSGLIHTSSIAKNRTNAEDLDASPSFETAVLPKKEATCLLVDEARGMLWIGYTDGFIAAYDISGKPGVAVTHENLLYCWQAHRVSYVTAMCIGPTGEIWTGSSRGTVRVWQPGSPILDTHEGSVSVPACCRELRRPGGERGHSRAVLHMMRCCDGQLVWSASSNSIRLWDADSGAYLGIPGQPMLLYTRSFSQLTSLEQAPGNPSLSGGAYSSMPSSSALNNSPEGGIGGATGLPLDPLTGLILAKPSSSEKTRLWQQQEAWAAQSDGGMAEFAERLSASGAQVVQGAGKAVKFMSRLGQKLASNLQGGGGNNKLSKNLSTAAGSSDLQLQQSKSVMLSSTSSINEDDGTSSVAGSTTGIYGGTTNANDSSSNAGAIHALVATLDNCVWTFYKRGRIERYNHAGTLLASKDLNGRVQVAAAVGRKVWVGFTNGWISIVAQDGTGIKSFKAHQSGIVSLVQAGSRVYSLAADGSITGWSAACPSAGDELSLSLWQKKLADTYTRQTLFMLCTTWNCGEKKPDQGSEYFRHLRESAVGKSLVAIALQEVEMGSTSVALAAAKDAISYKMQERGNTNAKFWSASVLEALGGDQHWHQIGLRQLSGMLVLLFARNTLKGHIGEVATSSVACGVLGVGGNKGAVAIECTIYRRKFTVVCSHFAAHQHAVEARNANYAIISKTLTFMKRSWLTSDEEEVTPEVLGVIHESIGAQSPSMRGGRQSESLLNDSDYDSGSEIFEDAASNTIEGVAIADTPAGTTSNSPGSELIHGEGMRAANVLVWMGDFNYRINIGYDEAKALIAEGKLDPLLLLDQCKNEMRAGRVFHGMREGKLTFAPTYKFDKGTQDLLAYDSSEKRRIPAWCDRIMYRGSQPFPLPTLDETDDDTDDFNDSDSTTNKPGDENRVAVKDTGYGSWSDVCESDHKPVYSTLQISLPVADYDKKRIICSDILQQYCPAHLNVEPELSLSSTTVNLHSVHMPQQMLLLSNNGVVPVIFQVLPVCVTSDAASIVDFWPDKGLVQPGSEAKLYVRAADEERGSFVPGPREVTFQVLAGPEYCTGDEEATVTKIELDFKVVLLPEYAAAAENQF